MHVFLFQSYYHFGFFLLEILNKLDDFFFWKHADESINDLRCGAVLGEEGDEAVSCYILVCSVSRVSSPGKCLPFRS